MDDISFFMLGYGQPKATDKCLESIRQCYPKEKIIVFENGTDVLKDVCKKHNAEYFHQHKNYQQYIRGKGFKHVGMWSMNDFAMFIDQHQMVCELTNTKWLVYLESDCFLRRRFKYFPKASVGGIMHFFNVFRKDIQDSINHFRVDNQKRKYIFSFAGGSIVNRMDLLKVCESDWRKHIQYAIDKNETYNSIHNRKFVCDIRCRDAMLSYLFYVNELEIEDWEEVTEYKWDSEPKTIFAAMIHDYKRYYE